jgi:DNA-binding winged helix-turn-helix (wHTH) protein
VTPAELNVIQFYPHRGITLEETLHFSFIYASDRFRSDKSVYSFEGIVVDEERLELRSNGEPVTVEPQVFSLLIYLLENRDRVISKDELIDSVWKGRIVSDATLNSRVNSLRRAVGDSGKQQRVIRTYPRRGFRFVASLETAGPAKEPGRSAQPSRERPSIAVLPFQFLADSQDQAYVARGITEEITTALSRIRWLFVVRHHAPLPSGADTAKGLAVSSGLDVDYALAGSVHKAGNDLRVSAQLTRTDANRQVWAERFAGRMSDIFALNDQIAFAIAAHLEPEITRAEIETLQRDSRRSESSAWEHYLHGISHMNRMERGAIRSAQSEFTRAIEIDPEFVLPRVRLAWCWILMAIHGWHQSGSEALALCGKHARKALDLDPGDARACCAMAVAEFWTGNQARAIEYAEQSLALDANMADAHGILGAAWAVSGDPQQGICSLERALKGSPRDPFRWLWHHSLANAYFAMEDYDEACTWADRAIEARPTFPQCHLVKAASLFYRGQTDAACREIKTIAEHTPQYSIRRIKRNPMWTDKKSFERLLNGARSAGLPA